jgi:DNA-binding MarR family transcriptional regulator
MPSDPIPRDARPPPASSSEAKSEQDATPRAVDAAKASSVAFLLSKLGMWSARRFAERLSPVGLEPRHAALLREIQRSEGVSQQRLAEGLGLPASRIVALVDDLEALRLVERGRNPEDRRAHAVLLTDDGRAVAEELAQLGADHEAEVVAPLSAEERRQLARLLGRLAGELDVPLDVHPEMAAPPRGRPPQTGGGRVRGRPSSTRRARRDD